MSVCPSVCPSVRSPPGPSSQAPGPASQAPGPASQARGPASQARGPASQAQGPASQAQGPASQARGTASQARGTAKAGPRHSQGRPEAQTASQASGCRGGNKRTDRQTHRKENLPILQDFVSYRGCCPASPTKNKEKVEQGKGTTDHLMPLGNLFKLYFDKIC